MRVLLQRVKRADVTVDNEMVGCIDHGLLLFVGIEQHDDAEIVERMVKKVLAYRVFSDVEGKMNLNVQQVEGGVLVISQFTLAANTQKGLRPSFSSAATPADAQRLFAAFVDCISHLHSPVEQGIFAADMQVSLVNDGPVTFLLQI